MTTKHEPAPADVVALRSVDLNLLVVLDALCRTRSVTAAAIQLGMTQSGCSRALARLRSTLDEHPLFLNTSSGLQPTARTTALEPSLASVLATLSELLDPPSFDPQTAQGPWHLGMPDHLTAILLPRLLEALSAAGPGIELVVQGFSRDWAAELQSGTVSMAFGVLGEDAGPHLRGRTLFRDGWSVVVRQNHPMLDGDWTPEWFAQGDHGLMTVGRTGPSHVDRALRDLGLQRRIVARTTSPLLIAMATAEGDLRVTTSTALARWLEQRFDIVHRPLPFTAPPLVLPLTWHARDQADPRHAWLRALLIRVVHDAFRE